MSRTGILVHIEEMVVPPNRPAILWGKLDMGNPIPYHTSVNVNCEGLHWVLFKQTFEFSFGVKEVWHPNLTLHKAIDVVTSESDEDLEIICKQRQEGALIAICTFQVGNTTSWLSACCWMQKLVLSLLFCVKT